MYQYLEYKLVKEFQVLFITLPSESQIIFWLINFSSEKRQKLVNFIF